MRRRALLLGTAGLAGGCTLGPPYRRPALDLPAKFAASSEGAQLAWPLPGWWRNFGSQELNALIERARDYNADLAAAAARVAQADAQVRINGSPLLPAVNGNANFSYQRSGTGGRSVGSSFGTGGFGGGGHYFDSRNYSTGLQASYDLDFWGRNRATYQASEAVALSTRFDQETVALAVVTSVASTYFQVLSGQDRVAVARNNLASAERVLGAYRARLTVGTATALDVSQQEALVAAQRAAIPNLENTIAQPLLGLGILVGTPPERLNLRGGSLTRLKFPTVAAGLPSALLQRRPDVAFAEAQLVAANANIRSARAAFFPSVTLTTSGGLASVALSTLTGPGTVVASLAAGLAQPIFDNGLRRGQLDLEKGREAELVANYAKAVLQALTDVEQSLAAVHYTSDQEALEQQAVDVAQRSADIARAQLEAGTIDIITSLNTQQTLFSDQDLLVQVRFARFQGFLNLYKALGGGWEGGALL